MSEIRMNINPRNNPILYFKITALLKNVAMQDESQEPVFPVTMPKVSLNTDLHTLGVAYGNPCCV